MKLIVGLGNPGNEYEKTRHNVGFMAIDKYCLKEGLSFKKKFSGLYINTKIDEEEVIFLKPQLYMNLSGEIVKKFADFFKIPNEDILVIHDDMDFNVGTLKLKSDGSSAGHNGIKNIINNLHTEKFKRLRIGISKNENNTIEYVLGKFSKEELKQMNVIFDKVELIIRDYTKIKFDLLMNKYN